MVFWPCLIASLVLSSITSPSLCASQQLQHQHATASEQQHSPRVLGAQVLRLLPHFGRLLEQLGLALAVLSQLLRTGAR